MKNKFRELVKKRNKIFATLGLIQWDLETKTPKKNFYKNVHEHIFYIATIYHFLKSMSNRLFNFIFHFF